MIFDIIKNLIQNTILTILTCLIVSLIFNYTFINFVKSTYSFFKLTYFFQTKNTFFVIFSFVLSLVKNFLKKKLIITNFKDFILNKNVSIIKSILDKILLLLFLVKKLYKMLSLKKRKGLHKILIKKIKINQKKIFNTQYFIELIIVRLFSKQKWITGDKAFISIPNFIIYNYNLIFVINCFFSFVYQIIELFLKKKNKLKKNLYLVFNFLGIAYILLFIYLMFCVLYGCYPININFFAEAANLLTGDHISENIFDGKLSDKYEIKEDLLIDKKYK